MTIKTDMGQHSHSKHHIWRQQENIWHLMPAGFPTWITESDAVSAVTELTIIQKTTFTALEHHWTLLGVFPPCGHPGFRRVTWLRISQKVISYWQLGDILSLNSSF